MTTAELTTVTIRVAEEAAHFQDSVQQDLIEQGWDQKSRLHVRQAVEEALVNALKHGNQLDQNKKVLIRYESSNEQVSFQITDEGNGFDPNNVPDPRDPENLGRPSGRGLLMMRHFMTEVTYNNKGNQVTMKKTRKA